MRARRQVSRAVEALVGAQHVATRPDEGVRPAQGVALRVEHDARVEAVVHRAVQHRAHLARGVGAHADARVAKGRIESVAGLRGHEPLAQVIRKLHEVGAAGARVHATQRVAHARAPALHVRVEGAVVERVRLRHELEAHARRQARIARGPKLLVLLLVVRAREHRHLSAVGQHRGQRGHVHPDAAAAEGKDLAGNERDARHQNSFYRSRTACFKRRNGAVSLQLGELLIDSSASCARARLRCDSASCSCTALWSRMARVIWNAS
jgi:hypothetical protein